MPACVRAAGSGASVCVRAQLPKAPRLALRREAPTSAHAMTHPRRARFFHPRRLSILLAGSLALACAAARAESPQASVNAASDPWYIGYNAELSWNPSLALINAPYAYARGYTGTGQVVAVFDSGLDTKHNQFKGRIAGAGYDAITGRVGVTTDPMWHGTFVSGIVAANRDGIGMMGVSYGAKLLPIRIVNAGGSITLSDSQLARGIGYATQAGARIFNNSWNATAPIQSFSKAQISAALPQTLNAYRAAVRAGAIIVFAAGNEGASEPGLYAALPLYYPELLPGWMAAVALDANGVIAAYSNRCGSAAAFCLAAPGTDIISTYKGGYGMASGTSFAAPMLAGAAAILKQAFPYLSNQQILAILFQSANKTGIYANSAIYGQGVLDLERATRPIGPLMVSTSRGGQPVALSASALMTSAAFGYGFVRAVEEAPLVARDDFGRGYAAPLSAIVARGASSFALDEALDAFGTALKSVSEDGTVLAARYEAVFAADGLTARAQARRFFLARETEAAYAAAGYNMEPSLAFDTAPAAAGGTGAVDRADLVARAALATPYLDLARDAFSFAYGAKRGRAEARLLVFGGRALAAPLTLADVIDPAREPGTGAVSGLAGLLRRPVGGVALGLKGGIVVEEETLLGTISTGATAFGRNNATYFTGLSADAALGGGVRLFGGAYVGVTETEGGTGSVIDSVSSIVTQSFTLGLAKQAVLGRRDRAGFVIAQPLRVVGGMAQLSIPAAMDLFGNLVERPLAASLAADGRELDLQGFYARPLGARASLNLGALVRLEPDHVKGAQPETVLMTRYRLAL